MHKIKEEGECWRTGLEVLQHTEDRETAQRMKSAIESLAKQTTYKNSEQEKERG